MSTGNYVCSSCGAACYHDGRNGDGPILWCGCAKRGSRYVDDGTGGYHTNPSGATPVEADGNSSGGTQWGQDNPYDTERR